MTVEIVHDPIAIFILLITSLVWSRRVLRNGNKHMTIISQKCQAHSGKESWKKKKYLKGNILQFLLKTLWCLSLKEMTILYAWCGHNLAIVNVTHDENLQNNLMMYTNYTKHCEYCLLHVYIHNRCITIVINSLLIHMRGREFYHSREKKIP